MCGLRTIARFVALYTLAQAGAVSQAGCASEPPIGQPPKPDRATFEADVYPVLLRDCGFPACHANADRFFQVFGPGRKRLLESTTLSDDSTPEEFEAAFHRARSMLASADTAEEALLLRKPLDIAAGGTAHEGPGLWDIYATTDSPGYQTLLSWAKREPDAP